MDIITIVSLVLGLISAIVNIFYLIKSNKHAPRIEINFRKFRQKTPGRSGRWSQSQSNLNPLKQNALEVKHLEQRLITLAGEKDTAKRLFKQLVKRYPGKSAQWYYEKAIHDLERDRK
jgi:hypothetical protein